MTPLKFCMRHWHDVGLISAVIAGVYLATQWGDLSALQRLLILNFIVVLLHQFEEYSWPGGFPAIANVVMLSMPAFARIFKPLNQLSAMCGNLVFSYGFYLIPVFFPNTIWLGLGPVLVGAVLQVIEHAIIVPYKVGSVYTAGLATTILGFVPVGVTYIYYIQIHGLASGGVWLAAVGYMVVGVVVCFYLIEQTFLGSDNPRYPFDQDELERAHILEKYEATTRSRAGKG